MKRLITLIALSSILSGCQFQPTTTIRTVPGVGSTYSIEKTLGEKDLLGLAKHEPNEDAWVVSDTSWTDVGYRETSREVQSDQEYILEVLSNNKPATGVAYDYHIHPNNGCSPPSPSDVQSFAKNKTAVRESLGIELVGKVVDETGVWTYSLTPQLEYGLNCMGRSGMSLDGFLFTLREDKTRKAALQGKDSFNSEAVDEYIEIMANHGLLLRYVSLD